ncbi:Hypothetical_protein [Hexamita inflata]|uniref:Hypothetical_protein n=1 Tax=Hexamita inflata TaxID=28002 RepID=A0AA86NRI8_9EUKA|nr:Hypothetical protein HINF_LOCUS11929 [Hexamita inflata]CAI9930878.1 Hypothetical protein HINF_LOCUS18523 [Hexamita inflata]
MINRFSLNQQPASGIPLNQVCDISNITKQNQFQLLVMNDITFLFEPAIKTKNEYFFVSKLQKNTQLEIYNFIEEKYQKATYDGQKWYCENDIIIVTDTKENVTKQQLSSHTVQSQQAPSNQKFENLLELNQKIDKLTELNEKLLLQSEKQHQEHMNKISQLEGMLKMQQELIITLFKSQK